MRRALALIAFLGAAALTLVAQSPSTRIIRGRVVADDSGDPIRNARVGTAEGPDAPAALTDADGRFSLTPVAADQHDLFVAKTGYVRTTVPTSAAAEIRLTRGAVIAGRTLDDLGDPMPLMNVAAFRVRRAAGGVTFERFRATETDDLGEYRLFGLPAGEFIVAAAPGRLGTATSSIPVAIDNLVFHHYYPNAETTEKAQPIAVEPGEEVPGIDFTVAVPQGMGLPPPNGTPAVTGGGAGILGRVVRADGLPVRRARVQLISAERRFTPYFVPTDDDGRFEFRGLAPGSYLVTAGTLTGLQTPYGASPGRIERSRAV
jgi:hypothetical protein